MKKFLKITGISLLIILLVLIVSPFLFKGKIIEVVKKEISKTMSVNVEFDDLGLNFFKSFPHASVSLNNLCITGMNEFEGDTLLYSKNLGATINIKSLFGNSGYEITKIIIDNALVHGIILEDGKANWDIFLTDEETPEKEDEASELNLSLKNLTIKNSSIYYDDYSSPMNASIIGLNLSLSGDMTADETTLKTNFTIDGLNFIMDKIPYLANAKAKADMQIAADLKNMKFTLADNSLQINEIKANIDGWVAMLEDEGMDMDLKLNTPAIQFKDVLSMIPVIYAKEFQSIKTAGEATLNAWVKGTMKGENLPAFDIKLIIADAMFQYPDLPKSLNNIQGNIQVANQGGSADKTVINLSRAHFEMGGNPFDLKLSLSTPISDPNINLSAVGQLNLSMIKEIYPLEDMELNGILDANMKLATRMSFIEKEQYENVDASGTLNIKDMMVKSENMDDIKIQNANLSFSPRYVDLSDLSVQIGKNDLSANGKLENFIPFFLKDETLKGTLSVNSSFLNLNDFMSEADNSTNENTEVQSDTTSMDIIEIPKNINFSLTGNFKEVIFDNMNMKNVAGQIIVKDGKVDMKNLGMNALGGKLLVNGYYDTGKNPKQPEVSMSLGIQEVSFSETFSTFVTIQKLVPIFEGMLGNFSTNLQLTTPLGADFMPILTSLNANGSLSSNNLEVKDVKVLDGLATALKNESLKTLKVKDLNLPFSINEGRVTTKPFDVKFGGGVMNLSGSTGLDQSIDYVAKVKLTDKLSNKYVQNVDVKIGGTFSNPKFSLDAKDLADQALGSLAESILGNEDSGAGLSEQVNTKLNEELEKQAENIRKHAKEAGDKLIVEAQKQGQKLIDEAKKTSNALARAAAVKAAETAAKKLEDEAEKQAQKLNEEAEKQIQSLKDKAGVN